MGDNQPQEPMTPLATSAAQQHEMFLAWVAAGFTEPQALGLLKTWLHALVMKS